MKADDETRLRLSVCLIIKNEERWLNQCLASIQPVADEIIVVDTGSTDTSCEIAERYGAKIFHFSWCDDFSQARNFSLEKATASWVLILDADEVIAEKDYDTLRSLTGTPARTPAACQILTRNYINRNDIIGWRANDNSYADKEHGCGWIPSIKTRLWSNHPEIRFSYPVHEVVTPALKKLSLEPQTCSIVIHHYGKLNQLQADAKGKRYFAIGLKKLADMSDAELPLRELAIQAGILKRFDEAIDLWQRYLKIKPDNAEAWLNLGTALFSTGKIDAALDAAKKATKLAPDLKEIHFNHALYELHLGRSKEAAKRLRALIKIVPEYHAAKFMHAAAVCCRDGNKKGRKAFNKIIGKNLTEEMIAIAGKELALTLAGAGRHKDAEKIEKAAQWLSDNKKPR